MKAVKDKEYSFNHVNERLKERFNILPISRKIFNELSKRFKSDKSNMILVENRDQEIHQITFKKTVVTFVYSVGRGYITTVLDWSCHEPKKKNKACSNIKK